MSDGQKQAKGPAKTIRVSTDMHAKFVEFQYENRRKSADETMALLLAPGVLHIPMPADVMDRWRAEAEQSGFPLEQWVAQRVEAWFANRSYAGEVRAALNELVALRKAMTVSGAAYAIHAGKMPPRPEGTRTVELAPGTPPRGADEAEQDRQ